MTINDGRITLIKVLLKRPFVRGVFWALAAPVICGFILWGTAGVSRQGGASPACVGTIDRKNITFGELSESIAGARCQLVLNYFSAPEVLSQFLSDKRLLAKLAWERLIMLKEAARRGISVADEDVVKYIESHPIFSRNGAFERGIYASVTRYNINISSRDFEERIRENLVIQRLKDAVSEGVRISDEEVASRYKMDNEKIKISYVLIENKPPEGGIKIEDDRIKDYYEKYKSEFMLPPEEGVDSAGSVASLKDVTDDIRSSIAEKQAFASLSASAMEVRKKITGFIEGQGLSFEAAALKAGAAAKTSGFFTRADRIDGLGDAATIVYAASALIKPQDVSAPVAVSGGAIIFTVLERGGIDEERFKNEKDDYDKKLLYEKKLRFLDRWFYELSLRASLKYAPN